MDSGGSIKTRWTPMEVSESLGNSCKQVEVYRGMYIEALRSSHRTWFCKLQLMEVGVSFHFHELVEALVYSHGSFHELPWKYIDSKERFHETCGSSYDGRSQDSK